MKYLDSYAVFEHKHDVNIIEELESGYCEFYYRKSDGSKRHAFGTLKQGFLKKVWEPKDDDSKDMTTGMVTYWDISKKAFRSFHKDSFIGLELKKDTLKEFLEKFPELEKKVKKAKSTFEEEEPTEKEQKAKDSKKTDIEEE